jgi:hypothetical protein
MYLIVYLIYFVGGEMQDHFHLNETGQLYLIKSLDRDGDINPYNREINFINLIVWATPYNYLKISPGPIGEPVTSEAFVPAVYKPSNFTQLWVRVTIQDKNDHPPKFRENTLSIGITRKTQFGELIFNLKVCMLFFLNTTIVVFANELFLS